MMPDPVIDPPRTVGVLHTVPALAETFEQMIAEAAPGVRQLHRADASLLADARRIGVTDDVSARVESQIRALIDDGADAVLVTCSSIGEAVETAAASAGVPVLRVDEPMAREATRIAGEAARAAGRPGRIAVLATLEATLGPTGRLIERAAAEAGGGAEVTSTVVAGAIEARESGDQARHDALVREAAVQAAAEADVVVLAQASMAAALAGADLDVPLLTSPPGGVAALAATLRATPDSEHQ